MEQYVKIKHWVPKDKIVNGLIKGRPYRVKGVVDSLGYVAIDSGFIIRVNGPCAYLNSINGWGYCDENGKLLRNSSVAPVIKSPPEVSISKAVLIAKNVLTSKLSSVSGHSNFGYVNKVGHTKNTFRGACIAPLEAIREPKVIYSWFSKSGNYPGDGRCSEEASREFLYWLCSKASPWKSVLPTEETFKKLGVNGSDLVDPEFRYKYGFVFPNIHETPANAIGNFLIGARFNAEYGDTCNEWYNLCLEGADPTVAYFFMGLFKKTSGSDFWYLTPNEGAHWPLQYQYAPVEILENFYFGKFVTKNKPFTEGGSYKPCNVLWFPKRNTYSLFDYGTESYYHHVTTVYKDLFEKSTLSGNKFASSSQSNQISTKNLLKIIEAEVERITKTQ